MRNSTRRLSGAFAFAALWILVRAGWGGRKRRSTGVSLAVTPPVPSIKVGANQQFTATATNKNGTQTDITSQVTWKSATTGVATISGAGLATGVTVGTSVITATLGTLVSTPPVTLTVTAPTLVSIAVTPVSPSIAATTTQQFIATGTYSDASTADITSQVTWLSATAAVATISPAGLATGVAVGTSNITAALSG